jgi:hypothetical protein
MTDILRHHLAVEAADTHPFARQGSHLAIVQEDDIPRVVQHRGHIRGQEISPLAETHHKWAAGARPDHGIGVVRTQDSDGIGPYHLL